VGLFAQAVGQQEALATVTEISEYAQNRDAARAA
jgi:hypothetical protein